MADSEVIATGNASVRMSMDAVHAGASDFISKPFNVCDLFSFVERAVQHKRPSTPSPD